MAIKFTIDASPNTTWRILVFVHPSLKAMHKARGDSGCLAFCLPYTHDQCVTEKQGGVFCELHFARGENMRHKFIVHECLHALVAYAKLCRLKIHEADYDGEEWLACSIEHMVSGILWMLKKRKVKVL